MRKRTTEAFASAGFGETREEDAPAVCAAPGCVDAGVYPAPRDRSRPRPFIYFCLEHIRAYNAGWDYYRGMNADQIEADRRLDVVWRRQTWAFGGKERRKATADFAFEDPLAACSDLFDEPGAGRPKRRFRPGGPEDRAQAELGLDDDFDREMLKLRYKALVKRWHPDANGGSVEAEERLKAINEAYRTLLNALDA